MDMGGAREGCSTVNDLETRMKQAEEAAQVPRQTISGREDAERILSHLLSQADHLVKAAATRGEPDDGSYQVFRTGMLLFGVLAIDFIYGAAK